MSGAAKDANRARCAGFPANGAENLRKVKTEWRRGRDRFTAPKKFTSIICRKSSTREVPNLPGIITPALFTTTSIPPNSSSTRSTDRPTCRLLVTSHPNAIPTPPSPAMSSAIRLEQSSAASEQGDLRTFLCEHCRYFAAYTARRARYDNTTALEETSP